MYANILLSTDGSDVAKKGVKDTPNNKRDVMETAAAA